MGVMIMRQFIKRPEIAEQARKLVAMLTGVNDEISDASLGEPPTSYPLRVAFRDLERANPPVIFRRIRNVGWKRMYDVDLVLHSEADLKRLGRGARRGRKRLGLVQFDHLTRTEQLHAARNNTRFAAIEAAAASVALKPLAAGIPDLTAVLEKIKAEQL